MSGPHSRRAFLAGAGAAALTLAGGAPVSGAEHQMDAPIGFDPAVVFDELRAAGLHIWLCKPVGRDASAPYYSITPARGGFTAAQLGVMAKWADFLETNPIEALLMKTHLADFEREMGASRG